MESQTIFADIAVPLRCSKVHGIRRSKRGAATAPSQKMVAEFNARIQNRDSRGVCAFDASVRGERVGVRRGGSKRGPLGQRTRRDFRREMPWGTRRRRSTVTKSWRKYGREMQCAVLGEVQIHEVIAARHDAAERSASRSPPLRHVALLSFDVAAGPSLPMRRVRPSRGLADRDAGIAGDLPEGVRTRLSAPRSSARPCEPEGRRERS